MDYASAEVRFLTRIALRLAVPNHLGWLANFRVGMALGAILQQWADAAADQVGRRGNALQFGGGPPGEAGQVFTILAHGVAALSMCPGGLRFVGAIWCERHSPGGRTAEPWETVCSSCISEGIMADRGPLESAWKILVEMTNVEGDLL